MNLTELGTTLINIWQVIPVELFQKLVESMPSRVAAIIKVRGGSTRYKRVNTLSVIKHSQAGACLPSTKVFWKTLSTSGLLSHGFPLRITNPFDRPLLE
ncbi:hypothetical protein TNCV_4146881 [Trichonephila clavipes]|nr:hypothetical protein TNCV_4146881 [Trichonephila clavipes]